MRVLIVVVILLSLPEQVRAEVRLGRTTMSFATVEEGKQVLTSRDDYVERMSAFDRAARLKTDKVVPEREYLEFVGKNVVAWEEAEKEKIYLAMEGVEKVLKKMALPFPEKIWLIKTTGQEEGNAAYTRANAIVFPRRFLEGGVHGRVAAGAQRVHSPGAHVLLRYEAQADGASTAPQRNRGLGLGVPRPEVDEVGHQHR